MTDPRGFVTEHTYDKDGVLVKLVEPDRGILLFDNSEDGLRYKKTDTLGYQTTYSYRLDRALNDGASDSGGNVTLEKDDYDKTVEYDYGIYDQITRVKDKNGNERRYTYYQTTNPGIGALRGKLEKAEARINGQWETLEKYTYYEDGNVKQKIEYIDKDNPNKKRVTNYTYQDNGLNLQQMTVTGQPGGESYTVTFTYDDLGRRETETLTRRTSPTDPTPMQLTTTYEYDDLDRVIKVTDPLGNIAETVYDANGKVKEENVHHKIPGGGYDIRTYVTREYDAADRLVKETDIYGKETNYEYDEAGNLVKVTDANGHITRFEYDARGRRTAVIDANGHRTETVYDLGGRVIKTINANGKVLVFEYDALGRKTKDITPMAFETLYEYDANGNLKKLTDANAVAGLQPKNSYNATVYSEYDEFNRLTKTVDALDGETSYTYDLLGNVVTITDAEGRTTEFVYDGLARLREVIDPIQETPTDKTVVFTYDEAGNVLTKTDRIGRETQYTYDHLNRLRITRFISDAKLEGRVYDMHGDLTGLVNNDVTYIYAYDNQHRMTSKTDNRLGRTLFWQYDDVGNVTQKTDYQDEVTEYKYDSTNRLVSLRNQAYVQVSYHYDPAGRLLDRILSNRAKTSYLYDDDNRLVELKNTSAGDKYFQTATYTHDNIGNIKSITDASGTVSFTYDALYRLTDADYPGTADDVTYTYDGVGNRLTRTDAAGTLHYIHNNQGNRVDEVREGSVGGPIRYRYVYDDEGNRIEKRDGADTLIQSYVYDQKNRISALTTLTDTHYFAYDPNDYRIKKEDSGQTRKYLLEGEHYEAVYDATDALIAKYLRGVVVDEIVYGYYYDEFGKKTNYTFHHDHLRSVVALTAHEGSTVETTKYGPFGEEIASTGESDNFLKYTGREHDEESGLYYYRARYYDPEVGRFLTEDPIGFDGGINFYTYVSNNPINNNDPTGHYAIIDDLIFTGGGAAVGLLAQGAVDLFRGEFSSWQDYIAAGAGGAAAGEALLYTGPVGAGIAGGATANLVKQGLYWASGEQEGFDFGSLAFDTTVGGATGLIPGLKIPGITQGRGSYNAIFKQMTTKFQKGTISDVTSKTAAKMFVGRATSTSFLPGSLVATEAGFSYSALFDGTANTNGTPAAGGFVLYPNKSNTNMMRSVYSK